MNLTDYFDTLTPEEFDAVLPTLPIDVVETLIANKTRTMQELEAEKQRRSNDLTAGVVINHSTQ